MDEARIQEIVDRVVAQLGHVPETPLEAVRNPPPGYVPSAGTPERERAPGGTSSATKSTRASLART